MTPIRILALAFMLAGPAACRQVKTTSNSTLSNEGTAGPISATGWDGTSQDDAAAKVPAICPNTPTLGVTGGQASAEGSLVAAHTVKIWIKNQRYCSGTLIGPQHVVTAAHCLRDPVGVEELRLGFGTEGYPLESVKVKAYTVHPRYAGIPSEGKTYKMVALYDLAVLSFTGELPPGTRPANLAKPENFGAGSDVIVAGYGAYASEDRQRRPLSQTTLSIEAVLSEVRELQLKRGQDKGACFGDSGGPTFLEAEGGKCLLLVGSTTGPGRNTNGTCEAGGGTLMDLSRYQGWISCAFEAQGAPLPGLVADASREHCAS